MLLGIFLLSAYLLCSFQFVEYFINNKKQNKYIKNCITNVVKIVKKLNLNPSIEDICMVFDIVKCCLFVVLSAYIFHSKNIVDITAIVSYFGHRFPVYYKFQNKSKNFISFIFLGFIIDPITGISMIASFVLASRICEYTSVAMVSAMIGCIVKVLVQFSFFENHNYFEMLFFLFFAILCISKNKKTMFYIVAKTCKNDKKDNNTTEKQHKLKDVAEKKDNLKSKYNHKNDNETINKKHKKEYKNSNKEKKQKKYKMKYKK